MMASGTSLIGSMSIFSIWPTVTKSWLSFPIEWPPCMVLKFSNKSLIVYLFSTSEKTTWELRKEVFLLYFFNFPLVILFSSFLDFENIYSFLPFLSAILSRRWSDKYANAASDDERFVNSVKVIDYHLALPKRYFSFFTYLCYNSSFSIDYHL